MISSLNALSCDETITVPGANSKRITLSWVRRLKIAVDAAKGNKYRV